MPVVSASLAGTKAKTKVRTISLVGKTSFRYKLAKNQGQAEKVRVLVHFKKGKVSKTATIACTVRVGSSSAIVNVAVSGGGVGSVVIAPGGTTCASDKAPCAKTYAPGTKVTLTAAPDTSSTFEGWSGGCSGKGPCVVKIAGVKTITAKFVKKQFKVTIEKAGEGDGMISSDGTLACGTACSATLEAGDIVRLKAEPDGNSKFVGWTGECTSTSTTCNFPVDGEITVTATFSRKGNRLNVSRSGTQSGGTITADVPGIDCGDTCSYTYPAGTVVTLTASAQPGYLFAGWRADCASAGKSATCAVTMDAVKFVSAEFQKGIPVTAAVTGTGKVTSAPAGIDCGATCTALFFPYTIVTLTAGSGGTFDPLGRLPERSRRPCQVQAQPPSPRPAPNGARYRRLRSMRRPSGSAVETASQAEHVLVTGASGGIERACARAFAAEGASCFVHSAAAGAAEAVAAELAAHRPARRPDARGRDRPAARRGALGARRFDVRAAVSGVSPREDVPVWELSLERWGDTLAEPALDVPHCAPLLARGGRAGARQALVIVASTAGLVGEAGHADYAAAKSAITGGLLLSLKNESRARSPRARVTSSRPAGPFADDARGAHGRNSSRA